jgi:hypothetical protein
MATVTYQQMRSANGAEYLAQHNFFSTAILASHWFPLASEAKFKSVHKAAMQAIAAQGQLDWSAVGTPGNLQQPNALRKAVLENVVSVEFPPVTPLSGIVCAGVEFIVALLLTTVFSQLSSGAYGNTVAQQYSAIEQWAQAAQTAN